MEIRIDDNAGYCFGVVKAIGTAEEELHRDGSLYCLGDIVHNSAEVERLRQEGLKVIENAKPNGKNSAAMHGRARMTLCLQTRMVHTFPIPMCIGISKGS